MSIGAKIYGVYMRQSGAAESKRTAKRRGRGTAICPFTLEAVKDCARRKRAHHTACSFSLEDCLAAR